MWEGRKILRVRYVALRSEHALQVLDALRRGEHLDETQITELRGTGDSVDRFVEKLQETLSGIKSRYPQELGPRDPKGGKFEAEACVAMHSELPYDPQMLADYEWWRWLAVFRFRELVEWRYGSRGGANPNNFGIGRPPENLLYRLWLRAEVSYDPRREDPYELARRGDQDFWRSHVLRQSYGNCRQVVRALVRFQFPDRTENQGTLKVEEIRELAKRLCRLHANLMFEYLDEEEVYTAIKREAELAKETVARSVAKK